MQDGGPAQLAPSRFSSLSWLLNVSWWANNREKKKKGGTEVNRKWTCCRLRLDNTLVSTSRFYTVLQPRSTCHPPPITGKLKRSSEMWKSTRAASHTALNCDQTLTQRPSHATNWATHQMLTVTTADPLCPYFKIHLSTSCWQDYVSYYISFWCKHWPQVQGIEIEEKIGEHWFNRLKPVGVLQMALLYIANGSLIIPVFQSESLKDYGTYWYWYGTLDHWVWE